MKKILKALVLAAPVDRAAPALAARVLALAAPAPARAAPALHQAAPALDQAPLVQAAPARAAPALAQARSQCPLHNLSRRMAKRMPRSVN